MTDAATTAQAVADAVSRVDGVVRLYGGAFGEVATYRAGSRISGVRIGDTAGEVHVVTTLDRNVRTIAEEARIVAEQVAGIPVTVTVADVATREEADVATREEAVQGQP